MFTMKKLLFILLGLISIQLVNGQNYMSKDGSIEIYAETSLLTIDGKTQTAGSIINSATGDVVASILVTSFKFKEALLEEHFNENYMESHKFPKAQFKGKITNWNTVKLTTDGSYPITIEGDLTMHGETRPLKTTGNLVVSGGKISANTEFFVSLENYKIKVEESYKDRIPDKIKLTLKFNYVKLEK
jgi:flagellar basal body rod protein FlgG